MIQLSRSRATVMQTIQEAIIRHREAINDLGIEGDAILQQIIPQGELLDDYELYAEKGNIYLEKKVVEPV